MNMQTKRARTHVKDPVVHVGQSWVDYGNTQMIEPLGMH